MHLKNINTCTKIARFLIKYQKLLLRFYKTQIQYRNDTIRMSIAYLYKIKIDNKYLLVKSRRIPDQFQPVGGVYKYLPSAENLFRELGVITETGYQYDSDMAGDLRIELKGKNVLKLIRWFENGKDRETAATREFREELIKTNFLDGQVFNEINHKHLERIIGDVKFSDHFQCQELLIKDVYEIIPTPEQEVALRATMDTENDSFRWFSISEAKSLGRVPNSPKEYRVGPHTLDIL